MNEHFLETPKEKFKTPEEEIEWLRAEVLRKEEALKNKNEDRPREDVIREGVGQYMSTPAHTVLHDTYAMKHHEQDAVVLDLAPEEHDVKMSELLGLVHEKGVLNVLGIVEKMRDPHIADDFHRFLIQYIKAGFEVHGIKQKSRMWRELHTTLYEIVLPESGDKAPQKSLKELVSSMEQLYAGMLSISDEKTRDEEVMTFEIANAHQSEEFVFYCSIPDEKRNLFEKQVLSIFPDARVLEKKDDYNIFAEGGVVSGSIASLKKEAIYPIRTYESFDFDPLNVLLNSFSKIQKEGEGAALQIVFNPVGDRYMKPYRKAIDSIAGGTKVKDALNKLDTSASAEVGRIFKEVFGSAPKKDEIKKTDDVVLKEWNNKASSPIVEINLRLVASAANTAATERMLSDVESAFNQFENTVGNKIIWNRLSGGKLDALIEHFTYREFSHGEKMPVSIKELTTFMHFPASGRVSTSQVKLVKSVTAPAPLDLPQSGTLLGTNTDRGRETKVFLSPEDRLRHFYTIGQTGTGKTTILKNMILQDIRRGDGVCMIDPHGSDIQDILSLIPPERYNDVIYFDPAYTDRPMALNMLEYDIRFPDQKSFVVNEMLSIFNKLFDMKTAGGPMFEQYFRNAVLLTIEDPTTGSTLLDVSRVLSSKTFRELKLSKCTNPLVIQFWREIADKAGGEASLQNIVPYIVSKFDNFLANDIMRPVISQEKSSFNFRDLMDKKKILLVNLSKGRLGDINANLIGLIIVGKILMAALSRVDMIGREDIPPYYLYIDEFQNVTTDSISTILSEARKYKLSLNVAHQFTKQLDEGIKNAVFGNVGSMAVFRVGVDDAEYFEKQFAPVFTSKDIMNIDNFNAYAKILANGKPARPFNFRLEKPEKGNPGLAAQLKELSYLTYGRPRSEVEGEILKKYESMRKPAPGPISLPKV
jgi:hypothetical protein